MEQPRPPFPRQHQRKPGRESDLTPRPRFFVDYLRNARGATAVAPYSTRARAGAPVPLSWNEVSVDLKLERFSFAAVRRRLADRPDPWKGFSTIRQALTDAIVRKLSAPLSAS